MDLTVAYDSNSPGSLPSWLCYLMVVDLLQSLGIDQTQTDYGQHAIITNVAFEKPLSGLPSSVLPSLVRLRFCPCGLSG